MSEFIEFEVGDTVHLLEEQPSRERVFAAGCDPSDWIDDMLPFAGKQGMIVKKVPGWAQHGHQYEIRFEGMEDPSDCAFYGIDLAEFYEKQQPILTQETLMDFLLG